MRSGLALGEADVGYRERLVQGLGVLDTVDDNGFQAFRVWF